MKFRILQAIWLTVCLGAAVYFWNGNGGTPATSSSAPPGVGDLAASLPGVSGAIPETPDSPAPGVRSTPIEQIRVGERVLAHNPEWDGADRDAAEPDARWLQVDLLLGGDHPVEIVLLRPQWWVEEHRAEMGATIYLDLPELGARGDAEVLDIRRAPAISPGGGSVVTGTFKHMPEGQLYDVIIEGEAAPIGVTGEHPFWSVDRQAFVPVAQLTPDETLLARDGSSRKVISLLPRPGPEPVYNIEVHGEHVYQVAGQGLLVHNNKGTAPGTGLSVGLEGGGEAALRSLSWVRDKIVKLGRKAPFFLRLKVSRS